jgi:hypothetical protein
LTFTAEPLTKERRVNSPLFKDQDERSFGKLRIALENSLSGF